MPKKILPFGLVINMLIIFFQFWVSQNMVKKSENPASLEVLINTVESFRMFGIGSHQILESNRIIAISKRPMWYPHYLTIATPCHLRWSLAPLGG